MDGAVEWSGMRGGVCVSRGYSWRKKSAEEEGVGMSGRAKRREQRRKETIRTRASMPPR
jgi:hypothetical protein